MVIIEGVLANKVNNIVFDGLEFAHAAWYGPDRIGGWMDSQDNVYYSNTAAYNKWNAWLPSAITANYATNIDFLDCRIAHIGKTGLNMVFGINNCNIIGNEFYDMAAGAVSIGTSSQDDAAAYTGDARQDTYNIDFSNNYVHHTSNMYHASASVSLAFISDSKFTHNDVEDNPYTGFHIHWGWEGRMTLGDGFTNVHIDNNYVYNTMHGSPINDGAAIYTMGSTGGQHGNYNTVSGNYVHQTETTGGAGGIYNDQGSCYWEQRDNVIDFYDATKNPIAACYNWSNIWSPRAHFVTFYDTFASENSKTLTNLGTMSGDVNTTMVRDRQWPDKAKEIIANAGLQPEYRKRLGGAKTEGFHTLVLFNGEEKYIENELYEARTFKLKRGESRTLTYEGQNTYGNVVPESDYKVEFKSLTPSILAVDGNTVTANGVGEGTLEFTVTYDGGKKQIRKVSVLCGYELGEVKWKDQNKTLAPGGKVQTQLTVLSAVGNEITEYSVSYYSTNKEVANIDSKGIISAYTEGECEIVAAVTLDGITKEARRTFTCQSPKKFDTTGFKVTDISDIFADEKGWYIVGGGTGVNDGNGKFTSTTPLGYAIYQNKTFGNELLSFNALSTGPETGWGGIVFGQVEPNANPTSNANTYLMIIKKSEIELHRFNNGNRTIFFGTVSPRTGHYGNIDNSFVQFNKTYNIQLGAIPQDNGTIRLIMNVDGYNVFDVIDEWDGKLGEPGYFGCINNKGGDWVFSKPTESTAIQPGDTSRGGFTDIVGHWANSDITKLFAKGYVSGIDPTTFAPNKPVTRAEFTSMLTRVINATSESATTELRDVSENAWYAKAVAGAIDAEIIDAHFIENDCFNPTAPIRRDEMASMMVLAYNNYFDDYPKAADISTYNDDTLVESWAVPYMKNAVGGALMYGDDINNLNPLANATRAEAAAMLSRFVTLIE